MWLQKLIDLSADFMYLVIIGAGALAWYCLIAAVVMELIRRGFKK